VKKRPVAREALAEGKLGLHPSGDSKGGRGKGNSVFTRRKGNCGEKLSGIKTRGKTSSAALLLIEGEKKGREPAPVAKQFQMLEGSRAFTALEEKKNEPALSFRDKRSKEGEDEGETASFSFV